jgi:lipid II:glycine glycyltransferase (peptidoglycan interpeptide bridge formation enzyme)
LAGFLDQRLLAAIFITHIGNTASYVYGGYVDGAEKHSPTQVLHDEAIRECLAKGLADYNFGTLLGPKQPEARGVDEFKLGFGAVPRQQQDTLVWVRKPVLYASMERLRRGWLGRSLESRLRQVLIRRGEC